MKIIASLPLKTFCGLEFGNRYWSKHLHSCVVCQQAWLRFRKAEDARIRAEWKEPCQCGCGGAAAFRKRFINGHGHRIWTDEQKRRASDRVMLNPPMRNEETRRKVSEAQVGVPRPWQIGDKNPAKRSEVRAKISQKNPMLNADFKAKQTAACRTDKERLRRSLFMREHSCQFDPLVVARRVDTYTQRQAEGKYHLKNNWKTGFYVRSNGEREWYDSSYEMSRMMYYDAHGICWTKKHKIRIAYINAEGRSTFYVPDFFLTLEDGRCVVDEIKGWMKDADRMKANVAIEFCKQKGWWYRFFLGGEMEFVSELSYIGE